MYDGVNYRVLRARLSASGWPPGLQIKILSAKYGLIDSTTLVEPYNQRLGPDAARGIRSRAIKELNSIPSPSSVFVNLGKDYLPAVEGIERLFPTARLTFAEGPIGMKMRAMKQWLNALPDGRAPIGRRPKRSYLYFFPDWDDFVYEPFTADDSSSLRGTKRYAHELCGAKIPFDGILLSLSHLRAGKGLLHRLADDSTGPINVRKALRLPKNLLLFGDCGAFSYAGEPVPPFTPAQAATLYNRFGFDIGASVDHIPLPKILARGDDGSVRKKELGLSTRYSRMYLTRDNAEAFLRVTRQRRYNFVPLGVIQGIGVRSYVSRLHEYLDMGYEHIAVGGLVPRRDRDILDIVCALRRALQQRGSAKRRNVWLHLFGILRPKLQGIFRDLGVSSFDSASYFRKAWLRSDQNYLAPDGRSWYGTIRVPISSSPRMIAAAERRGIARTALVRREADCLAALQAFENRGSTKRLVLQTVDRYGPLLERKGEENHFRQKHALLLQHRPWDQCRCPFCRGAGIHVVVFRGASRNKRRGLHNTWVFYHKVLHGHSVPTSAALDE
jgi:hypothetical protein